MDELALFAGGGGGILGGGLLGWRTRCAVELDPYARKVLLARQRDGMLPRFPIWDDVRTFDGKPWRGHIDVISGGFPCQDISSAGRGEGITGKRSGLWSEMARIVANVVPRYVFVENSPMLTARGLGVVLGDLASMGYNARWGVLGANYAGAPHKRDRIWILAYANSLSRPDRGQRSIFESQDRRGGNNQVGSLGDDRKRSIQETRNHSSSPINRRGSTQWWEVEPQLGRVADGVAHRMDRLRAIGNGQVPAVAALAWEMLGGDC